MSCRLWSRTESDTTEAIQQQQQQQHSLHLFLKNLLSAYDRDSIVQELIVCMGSGTKIHEFRSQLFQNLPPTSHPLG